MTIELLTPGEVARAFRVTPRCVTRWADQGKLTAIRNGNGHRRYYADQVRAILTGSPALPPLPPQPLPARRMADNHARIRQVPCPHCGALPFAPCRGPAGWRIQIPHQARRHAAAEAGVYTP